MKPINTNAAFAQASHHLSELLQAEREAVAHESKLLALLAAPTEREPVLAAAARLLRGEPATPANIDGLNRQLDEVRGKLAVLRPAIEQQREVVQAIESQLSAAVCAEQAPEHLAAVQGVADALEALRAAFNRLQGQREAIESAGYRCSLEAFGDPALSFDSDSAAVRVLADCHAFATLQGMKAGGPVNVRLLAAGGLGLPGDVVGKVPAAEAAQLVRLGVAEVTQVKPQRVPRLTAWGAPAEVVLS